VPAQALRHQAGQLAMVIQPHRHRLQLTADLVSGEAIESAGLDGALLAHCRLRRLRVVFGNQWPDATVYPKSPGLTREKSRFSKSSQQLDLYGRALGVLSHK
jgi:hypothetical protein